MTTFLVVDTESLHEAVTQAGRHDVIHVADGAFRAAPKVEWDDGKGNWRVTGGDFRPPEPALPAGAAGGPTTPGYLTITPGLGSVHGNRMCLGPAFEAAVRRGLDLIVAALADGRMFTLPAPDVPPPPGFERSWEQAVRAFEAVQQGQAKSSDWTKAGECVLPAGGIPYDAALRSGEIVWPSPAGSLGRVGEFPAEGSGARDVTNDT